MQPRFWASARNDQWEARTKDSMALLRSAVNGRKFSDEYMDSIMWALKVTVRQTAQGSCVGFPFPFCGWLLDRGWHLPLFISACLGYFSTLLSMVWLPELGNLEVVLLLLDAKADVDSNDNHNRTPLSLAQEFGHWSCTATRRSERRCQLQRQQ